MADVCVLTVDGLPAVSLKPNEIYRIGKQVGFEICIADESMELAHGIVSLLRSGIVRMAAVAGRIFVNNEEKQVADIRKEDATEGKVRLRFGNVEASLRFNEAQEEAQDSSGFGEGLKDRTGDTSDDSLCIPETQPPSVNNSVNTTADSFFIPETQAIVFERPTKSGRVSLGDDFMIPETEGDADLQQDNATRGSDDTESSGMGSQIRICTQDFNELNEDAIDDFDSSLMLGDALMALGPPKTTKESLEKTEKKQENLLDATDLEMSALNWSASNSKCTVLNSTKADKAHRADACITPELSAPIADANRDISTPDIFELMLADEEEQAAERSNATTPQLCGIKQLVVATIETPRSTQNEEDEASSTPRKNQHPIATPPFLGNNLFNKAESGDVNQDFVPTQAFPSRLPQQREFLENLNQDFIATQVFPGKHITSRAGQDSDNEEPLNQDFVETQAFPSRLPQPAEQPNQDFIATQAFPSRLPQPAEQPNQDFIATQAFPSKINTSRIGQDFIETQPFHVLQARTANKENIPQESDPPCSWSDEIEEILKEMVSGTVVSSPPHPNEEEIPYVKPCVIKDKDHNRKVFLFENVFPNVNNKNRWKNELAVEAKRCLKRIVSTDSQPPFATPSKRNRRLSEHSERLDNDYSLNGPRKRPASSQEEDKSEPPNKSVCKDPKLVPMSEKAEQSTEDEAAAPKVPKRPTRKAKTKSRSPEPVKKATRTRRMESKTKESKSEEEPPKVPRTRRQTKCLEPEEVDARPPEDIRSKRKAPSTEPTKKEDAEQSATKRGGRKLVESAKKNSEEATEKAKEPANKRGRKKLSESAKKDSEESINTSVEKRKPGRPRKAAISSSEDSIVETAKSTRNTRLTSKDDSTARSKDSANKSTNNSLLANKDESISEEQAKQRKKVPVVRLRRTLSVEGPSTSSAAASVKKASTAVEEDVSKHRSGATETRLSQPSQQDPLKAINKYVKQAKSSGKIKITFTMCNRQALESVLKALKFVVEVTEDPLQCDLVMMDKGERTYKFLTAIACNKPVLSTKWLESVKTTKSITVTDDHLFKDSNFERAFKFNPLSVLEHPRLFNGFNFILCEGIQPNANEMKAIIQGAGGRVHSKPPPLANSPELYVVTTKKDEHSKRRLCNYENVHFIKTEGVMQALVQHKVELLDEHKLKL